MFACLVYALIALAVPDPIGNVTKDGIIGLANFFIGLGSGAWQALIAIPAFGNYQFLWGIGTGVFVLAFFVTLIKASHWKRPKILSKIASKQATTTREEPKDIIITESATPTKSKPEEPKKEEVSVTESTS
jgi:hypothetical protein